MEHRRHDQAMPSRSTGREAHEKFFPACYAGQLHIVQADQSLSVYINSARISCVKLGSILRVRLPHVSGKTRKWRRSRNLGQ